MINIAHNKAQSFGAVVVPRYELIKKRPDIYQDAAYASHNNKPIKINDIPDAFMVEHGAEKAQAGKELTDYFIFKSSSIAHKSRHEYLLGKLFDNNSIPAHIVSDDEITDTNNPDPKAFTKKHPQINIVV